MAFCDGMSKNILHQLSIVLCYPEIGKIVLGRNFERFDKRGNSFVATEKVLPTSCCQC
jgi:hypothetical protein